MPQNSKGARLWLRQDANSSAVWVIRHGRNRVSTTFGERDRGMAEIRLAEYIATIPKRRQPSLYSVYFIVCGDYVKIGTALDPQFRLLSLRTGNPFPLILTRVVSGGYSLEAFYKRYFRKYLHRDEWFRIEGELKDWLDGGPDPWESGPTGNQRATMIEQTVINAAESKQELSEIIEEVG